MQFIDLKSQYQQYKDSIDSSIHSVLNHGKYLMGPEIEKLEQELSDFVGVKHCVTVGSGTVSLEIALRALDIGPGDEVITVPFTWISTAEVIMAVKATPIFIDIELDSYNMNPDLLETAINKNTKAIIPVSLFGQIPNIEKISSIAKKYNLPVIEDGAQSFGAERNGIKSCATTIIGSTSFFPAKVLGCYGDGGALFTNDEELNLKFRSIRNHGGIERGHHDLVGMNGRFDTIQAAVLLAKLPHFSRELEARSSIGERYSSLLKEVCVIPSISEGNTHVYGQYTIRTKNRNSLKEKLQKRGIPTAIYYPKCLHEQPVFSSLPWWKAGQLGDFPASEKASDEVLSLPMHPFLTEEEQDSIVEIIKSEDREK